VVLVDKFEMRPPYTAYNLSYWEKQASHSPARNGPLDRAHDHRCHIGCFKTCTSAYGPRLPVEISGLATQMPECFFPSPSLWNTCCRQPQRVCYPACRRLKFFPFPHIAYTVSLLESSQPAWSTVTYLCLDKSLNLQVLYVL
jgi:hypothetical protein